MESKQRDILIATEIEPRVKHQTIFEKIDSLQTGECFELVNDHDPIPLYYQLVQTRGKDAYSWEYLEKGPVDFRILITKNDIREEEEEEIEVLKAPLIDPRVKHETIFKKFDSLKAGEKFILINDHDPMPLYYQLIQTHGEIFDWEYLERGPVDFRILITKTVDAKKPKSITDDQIEELDATLLEPWVKHATIFQRIEDLEDGDCFILVNDHDPVPLRIQMEQKWGKDTYDWEYLEEGPQWWRILITKNEVNNNQTSDDGSREVFELNATLIEPQFKHQTIFAKFDELEPGGEFVLYNDHDPVPLYYQLLQTRGDIFKWEYLEKGPVDFRILITKKPLEDKKEISTEGLETFNATEVEHRIRHAEIFKKFDALKSGEGFILKNDHDPKPLYYQLSAEKGDIFTWDYIEEGPQWWRIVIRKKVTGQDDETLAEIAKKGVEKSQVLDKFGLDYTNGGNQTLKEACRKKGVDFAIVEKELQEAKKGSISANNHHLQYDEWGIDFLADFLINVHHRYEKKTLPDLRTYAKKVRDVHGSAHPELTEINDLVQDAADALDSLLAREESILLPHIKEMVRVNGKVAHDHFDTLQTPIDILSADRKSISDNLNRIKELTNNFTLPEDACASYTLLFDTLKEFSDDYKMQTHLKNNILFPKALKIEA